MPGAATGGARETFQSPRNGENHRVWRITNEPEIRHRANDHNIRCWSADGRYLRRSRDAENKQMASSPMTLRGPHTGWLGLRQMAHTTRCEYDDLKLHPIKP
jgi:hypothetical protein